MEEDDDGLMLNLTVDEDVGALRRSGKQRWAEKHRKGKKRLAQPEKLQHVQVPIRPEPKPTLASERKATGTPLPESPGKGPDIKSKGATSQPQVAPNDRPIGESAQGQVGKESKASKRKASDVKSAHKDKFQKLDGGKRVLAAAPGQAAKVEGASGGAIWGAGGAKGDGRGKAQASGSGPGKESEGKFVEPASGVFAAESFADLGLGAALAQHIEGSLGFTAPTQVQKASIPVLLEGKDVLIKSDTGTGKTLAYLAPIVNSLQAYPEKVDRSQGTFAVILAPTRELCLQIMGVAQKLVHRFHWLVPGYVMGGENKNKEKARLRKGVTILVATPGRLLDHLQHTQAFNRKHLQFVVLDEADRLLDMGFEKDLLQIFEILSTPESRPRQTVLCSATLSPRLDKLVTVSLVNPARVGFAKEEERDGREGEKQEEDFRIPEQLVQRFIKVPCRLRLVVLAALLRSKAAARGSCKMVVFFSTCDSVDFHHSLLSTLTESPPQGGASDPDTPPDPFIPCPLFKLHGNLMQKERSDAFYAFRSSSSGVLFCTDVAGRGLDFPLVNAIVQYDTPGEAEEYVHRVGRTARLGRSGESLLFLQPNELDYLETLSARQVSLQELPLLDFLDLLPLGSHPRKKARVNRLEDMPDVHPGVVAWQARLEGLVSRLKEVHNLAMGAFRSFVRAYATHQGHLKRIFHVRKLHLGHVAKSFALRETPSLLGKSSSKSEMKKSKAQKAKKAKKRMKPADMGE